MAIVKLKKGEGRTVSAGGLWIFDNEIDTISGDYANGEVVKVIAWNDYPLGQGMLSLNSKIRIRLLTRDADAVIDDAFWYRRLSQAWEYRKKTVDTSSCRLVFGEADFMPGIVIDKFEDVLVIESLFYGIDRLKGRLLDILKTILAQDGIVIRGIYERSDAKVREQEGLPRYKGLLSAPFDTKVPIVENGVHYLVDVENGQKTGFFLDQKYNRLAIQRICKEATVLDCFTHTGSFALNAAYGGAREVLAVDASELAIEQARENARLNHFEDRVTFQVADVFDFLPALEEKKKQFDVVILDPPAFTKSRHSIKNAVKGYREINTRGMRLVKSGGYLATCSCSHFMDPELFSKTIAQAAKNAHKRLRQVEFRQQAPDHPILWAGQSDEPNYLKFYIFQVCDEF